MITKFRDANGISRRIDVEPEELEIIPKGLRQYGKIENIPEDLKKYL